MTYLWRDIDPAFWQRVNGGTIFGIDKDVKVEADALKEFKTQAEEFAHGMRRMIAARGLKAEQLDSDVSNFGNQVDSIMGLISGSTGIPQRILLGRLPSRVRINACCRCDSPP